jgi:hypothetical protein
LADINIQRKQGPGMWPWIIGALALILVVGAVLLFTGNDDPATAEWGDDPAAPAATPQAWLEDTGPTYWGDPAQPGTQPGVTPGTQPGTPGTQPGTQPGTPGTPPDAPPGQQPGTPPGGEPGTGTDPDGGIRN